VEVGLSPEAIAHSTLWDVPTVDPNRKGVKKVLFGWFIIFPHQCRGFGSLRSNLLHLTLIRRLRGTHKTHNPPPAENSC
jgi:hypothetical protein